MIAAGTLEERIDEMISRKQSLADGVLTTGEEFLTSLSTKELMEIVTLRDEIFSEENE
jgi:SNF2 family DNA or RNA helicase